jgi:hypothetical protein
MESMCPASIPNFLKNQDFIIKYIIYVGEYNTIRASYNK